MLVLSRKEGQRIQIGDDVWITVLKVKGNRVSIGIEAPNEVSIRRCELTPEQENHQLDREPDASRRDRVA